MSEQIISFCDLFWNEFSHVSVCCNRKLLLTKNHVKTSNIFKTVQHLQKLDEDLIKKLSECYSLYFQKSSNSLIKLHSRHQKKFPYKLPNDFRHRISGNQQIMEKSQKWVELEPSTKSPLGKKTLWYQFSKIPRNQISKFLILYGFVWFLGIVSLVLFIVKSWQQSKNWKKISITFMNIWYMRLFILYYSL